MTLLSPAVNSDRSSIGRRKRKKIHHAGVDDNRNHNPERRNSSSIDWKSETRQQIYSSKLLQALRRFRLAAAPPGPKRVHEAADRVLASTAKGRTRWSRAILTTNRIKLKFLKKKNSIAKRQSKVMTVIANGGTTGVNRSSKKSKLKILRLKSQSMPAVQRKARVLSRLVPGCRKESLPVVLEEATDYIPALEMQVRAMTALADLLSVSGTTPTPAPANGGGGSSSGY